MVSLLETRIGSHYHEIGITKDGRRQGENPHDASLIESRMTAYPKGRKDKLLRWHRNEGVIYGVR